MSPLPLQEFARCIINTDPAEYALPVPNIVHFLVAYEWQHLYIAKKAGLCDNMPTKGLKRIAVNSGMLQGRGRRRGPGRGGVEGVTGIVGFQTRDMLYDFLHRLNIYFCEAFSIMGYCGAAKDL